MSLKYKKGFTLIELLVVIAIIGILSSVVLTSLTAARAKARDARRASDINQLTLALEMYYDSQSPAAYPVALTSLAPEYIPLVPTDPSTGSAYSATLTTSSYCLVATLEKGATGKEKFYGKTGGTTGYMASTATTCP